MFSVSSLFLLQLVLKLTLLKVFLYHLCAVHVDNMSAKIKLSANKNEGATSHDRLKNVDIPVLFL